MNDIEAQEEEIMERIAEHFGGIRVLYREIADMYTEIAILKGVPEDEIATMGDPNEGSSDDAS